MNLDLYILLQRYLYTNKKLETAVFERDFSDDEKNSVNFLINEINNHVTSFFEKGSTE